MFKYVSHFFLAIPPMPPFFFLPFAALMVAASSSCCMSCCCRRSSSNHSQHMKGRSCFDSLSRMLKRMRRVLLCAQAICS